MLFKFKRGRRKEVVPLSYLLSQERWTPQLVSFLFRYLGNTKSRALDWMELIIQMLCQPLTASGIEALVPMQPPAISMSFQPTTSVPSLFLNSTFNEDSAARGPHHIYSCSSTSFFLPFAHSNHNSQFFIAYRSSLLKQTVVFHPPLFAQALTSHLSTLNFSPQIFAFFTHYSVPYYFILKNTYLTAIMAPNSSSFVVTFDSQSSGVT
jgi:hypothetical protein